MNIRLKAHPLTMPVNQLKEYTFFSRNRGAYLLIKRLYYYSNHAHSVHRVGVDPFQVTFRSNVALQSVHYTWSGFMKHNTRKIPPLRRHTGWMTLRSRASGKTCAFQSILDRLFFPRAFSTRAETRSCKWYTLFVLK